MHVLRWTFKLFIISGYFPPLTLTCPRKRLLYNLYMVIVTSFLTFFAVTLIFDFVYNVGNKDALSETFGVTITVLVALLKLLNLVVNRKTIVSLLNILGNEPFLPVDAEDKKIFMKFEKLIEKLAVLYTLQIMTYLGCTLTLALINLKYKRLLYRVWLPFDLTSSWLLYSLALLHQIISATFICIAIIIFDTLFAGLLLHACCQFELLEHRLQNIEGDKVQNLKYCARHHELIYRFSEKVNDLYGVIFCFQFAASTGGICFNLYRITSLEASSQFIEAIVFIICGLIQTLIFCWHGHIAKLKSLEIPNIIFHSNWLAMDKNAKKILLIIMTRSFTPVEIISAHVLPMNLESFKGLMKAIYSAYNMLRQTKSS